MALFVFEESPIWPHNWKRWQRRLFVLTFPLSGVLWAVIVTILAGVSVLFAGAVLVVAFAITYGIELWTGEIWEPKASRKDRTPTT